MKSWMILSLCLLAQLVFGTDLQIYCGDIKTALPSFARFGKTADRKVELLDADGQRIGSLWLAPAGKYKRVEGYNGYIDAALVVDLSGRIAGVALGKNSETPRWITRIRKGGMLTRWNGKTPAEAAVMEVDAVTRATYSSNAIKGEVKAICTDESKKQ